MQKHLNFSLSIVIVTLVAAAVLGLFYWQLVQEDKTFDWQKFAFVHRDKTTEIDISDWLTYRNEKYGFEMKYPKNWFLQDDILTNYDPSKVIGIGGLSSNMLKIDIDIEPLNNKDEEKVLECWEDSQYEKVLECSNVNINNLSFKKMVEQTNSEGNSNIIKIITIKNNIIYSLLGYYKDNGDIDGLREIEAIFNSVIIK